MSSLIKMNMSSSVSQNSTEQSIDSLEKEKNFLRSQEKYIEANEISQQIKNLKSRLQKEKLRDLKEAHEYNIEMMNQSFNQDMQNIESTWDKSISEYIQKCDKEINSLASKHSRKIMRVKDKLESEILSLFKPSTGLLNMMRCKEQAVKQEKYVEAQALLLQIEQIRVDEEKKHVSARKVAIEQQIINLDLNFEKKLQAMRKRHKTMMDEMNIKKNEEADRVIKKFENLKREFENSHNIKINICEGKHTTSAGRHSQSPEKISGGTLSPFRQKSLGIKSDN